MPKQNKNFIKIDYNIIVFKVYQLNKKTIDLAKNNVNSFLFNVIYIWLIIYFVFSKIILHILYL